MLDVGQMLSIFEAMNIELFMRDNGRPEPPSYGGFFSMTWGDVFVEYILYCIAVFFWILLCAAAVSLVFHSARYLYFFYKKKKAAARGDSIFSKYESHDDKFSKKRIALSILKITLCISGALWLIPLIGVAALLTRFLY